MLDMEEFLMLRDLFNQGLSISEIARQACHSRVTVRKYINSQVPPTPAKRAKRQSKLDAYKDYINQRLQEYPPTASRIYREIREQGFTGNIPSENKLEEKIRGIAKFQLLIVDEMGYLPFDDHGAHCFFQLISRRYKRVSTIFTSNKSYGEWCDIFKDHVIAAAILDRILHHCTTVNIKGDSYRLKERKRQGLIPKSFSC